MVDKKISQKELKELREEILNHTSRTETKKSKLIFDGRQYSLRFPKNFVDEAQIQEGDSFLITLEIPEYTSEEEPRLKAELERKNGEE
jgi:hypothetical protein